MGVFHDTLKEGEQERVSRMNWKGIAKGNNNNSACLAQCRLGLGLGVGLKMN